MTKLQVKFSKRGSTIIVSIIGELDHHSAEYIKNKVDSETMKSTTKNVIFDFSKVSFMDSSGIGTIIGRYKNIQKLNGKTAIVNMNTQIKRIFVMSGLMKIIPEYESIDEALSAINV
jgi:stage II sporulation protein AA (anti-sigma F factor antagonist)